jgi:hypothetical protein
LKATFELATPQVFNGIKQIGVPQYPLMMRGGDKATFPVLSDS